MASHRAQLLLTFLPTALAFGLQVVEPEIEPLKVWDLVLVLHDRDVNFLVRNLDTDVPIDYADTDARFFVSNLEHSEQACREDALDGLVTEWIEFDSRQVVPDARWVEELAQHLEDLAEMRISHVQAWVKSNLTRFQAGHASVVELQRTLESAVIDLKSSVQLCREQCASCQLLCIQNRLHDGEHDCKTTYACMQGCEYSVEAGGIEEKTCSMR